MIGDMVKGHVIKDTIAKGHLIIDDMVIGHEFPDHVVMLLFASATIKQTMLRNNITNDNN
jgi:hypothetical protein